MKLPQRPCIGTFWNPTLMTLSKKVKGCVVRLFYRDETDWGLILGVSLYNPIGEVNKNLRI
jgi:hypothetical protein